MGKPHSTTHADMQPADLDAAQRVARHDWQEFQQRYRNHFKQRDGLIPVLFKEAEPIALQFAGIQTSDENYPEYQQEIGRLLQRFHSNPSQQAMLKAILMEGLPLKGNLLKAKAAMNRQTNPGGQTPLASRAVSSQAWANTRKEQAAARARAEAAAEAKALRLAERVYFPQIEHLIQNNEKARQHYETLVEAIRQEAQVGRTGGHRTPAQQTEWVLSQMADAAAAQDFSTAIMAGNAALQQPVIDYFIRRTVEKIVAPRQTTATTQEGRKEAPRNRGNQGKDGEVFLKRYEKERRAAKLAARRERDLLAGNNATESISALDNLAIAINSNPAIQKAYAALEKVIDAIDVIPQGSRQQVMANISTRIAAEKRGFINAVNGQCLGISANAIHQFIAARINEKLEASGLVAAQQAEAVAMPPSPAAAIQKPRDVAETQEWRAFMAEQGIPTDRWDTFTAHVKLIHGGQPITSFAGLHANGAELLSASVLHWKAIANPPRESHQAPVTRIARTQKPSHRTSWVEKVATPPSPEEILADCKKAYRAAQTAWRNFLEEASDDARPTLKQSVHAVRARFQELMDQPDTLTALLRQHPALGESYREMDAADPERHNLLLTLAAQEQPAPSENAQLAADWRQHLVKGVALLEAHTAAEHALQQARDDAAAARNATQEYGRSLASARLG